jgi:hypothetical protein
MGTFSSPHDFGCDVFSNMEFINTSVATIDSNGKATAVGIGTATITASAGGKSGSTT